MKYCFMNPHGMVFTSHIHIYKIHTTLKNIFKLQHEMDGQKRAYKESILYLLHRKRTWNLKITPLKRILIFQTSILRVPCEFSGVYHFFSDPFLGIPWNSLFWDLRNSPSLEFHINRMGRIIFHLIQSFCFSLLLRHSSGLMILIHLNPPRQCWNL